MTNMLLKDFTKDIGFILAFLVGALGVNVIFGNKVLYYYLILVLVSMLVVNSSKISYYARRVNNG